MAQNWIRVKRKRTNQTGSLLEEDFNPNEYERLGDESTAYTSTEKPLGRRLTELVTGRASEFLLGGGEQLAKQASALVKKDQPGFEEAQRGFTQTLYGQPTAPSSLLQEFVQPVTRGAVGPALGEAAVTGVSIPIGNVLAEKIGAKVLTKALSTVGLRNFLRVGSKGIQRGIREAKSPIGKSLGDLFEVATKAGKKINVGPIFDDLYKILQQVEKEGDDAAFKNVSKIIQFLENNTEKAGNMFYVLPDKAEAIKRGMDKYIFGEAGKELSKRGAGIAEKTARTTVANKLRDLLRKEIPGAGKLMDTYHSLGLLEKEMSQPLKNWWLGGLAGMLAGSTLGPGIGAKVGVSTALAAMPYTRNLLRKLAGETVKAMKYPFPFVVKGIESLIPQTRKGGELDQLKELDKLLESKQNR